MGLDGELEIPGYGLQGKDRLTGEGGGVAVYIKDTLCWHRRQDLETDDIECIWIELSFNNKSRPILLGNIYRPPDTSLFLPRDFDEKFETMLEKIDGEEKETLLLGDMNCDFLKKASNNLLKHVLSSQGFVQNVKNPTRVTKDSKTLIDVILSNRPQNLPETIVIESGLSDHHMVGTVRKLNSLKFQPRLITCRNFKHYDKEKFAGDLKNAPWALGEKYIPKIALMSHIKTLNQL